MQGRSAFQDIRVVEKILMQAEQIMITQDQALIPFYYYVNQCLLGPT